MNMSAGRSEEPGKRNSFSFTGPQAAAEQNSNKISRIILFYFILFFETAHFFNVPSNDYNMHTYVWLVFALNILFKLVWENLIA